MDSHSLSANSFSDLLEIARTGIPPGEADPIDGETADEAYETYRETGVLNPFHAETIRLREEYDST
jgi:hypothetical protein